MALTLFDFGWDEEWQAVREAAGFEELLPGRVIAQHRIAFRVRLEEGERSVQLPGRMRREAASPADLPAVGDWVLVKRRGDMQGLIQVLLPRRTKLSRKVAGMQIEEQVLAANLEMVWIACGMDGDFNLRRIERYVAMAHESGATPLVVLTKRDLSDDPDAQIGLVRQAVESCTVVSVSAAMEEGKEQLERFARPAATVAILGSSGVGKSTIVNWLAGEKLMEVGRVREADGKGRHTTSRRELLRLDSGLLVIDTPGMRELALWESQRGLGTSFPDVEAVAGECRFRDCGHREEPGCAVREAVARGFLEATRVGSYLKLKSEQSSLTARLEQRARAERKGKAGGRPRPEQDIEDAKNLDD